MASFSVRGLDELCEAFGRAEKVPADVTRNILLAMAEAAKKAQSKMAAIMLTGPYATGITQGAIKINSPQISASGGKIKLSFKGSRTRGRTTTRNAEIAYINEFGKRGQGARPFIKTANETAGEEINAAGEREFNAWLDKTGL